ncbi:MAG: FAD binding domain-containing protein, partial [Planctomycetota bacterium]
MSIGTSSPHDASAAANGHRDHIECFVNGQRQRVHGETAFWTLSDFLRHHLGQTGSKIVCAEGDCGACSVLIGKRDDAEDDRLNYQAVDSCIVFMHQLDQCHVVSIEGIGDAENLSEIQQAMVNCHGSQCGFCTPGFVTTMHGIVEQCDARQCKPIAEDTLRLGLSGNLCRCTGYVQIVEAAKSVSPRDVSRMNDRYPPGTLLKVWDELGDDPISLEDGRRTVFAAKTVDQAIAFKTHQVEARMISGATDVGVQNNHGHDPGDVRLDLSGVESMRQITVDDVITIGATATWTELLGVVEAYYPDFGDVIRRFGSPQIRNFGSIGGNLANASPIADSIPFLYSIDAKLRLQSVRGIREVSVVDFYLGYKKTELLADEIITAVICPIPEDHETVKL